MTVFPMNWLWKKKKKIDNMIDQDLSLIPPDSPKEKLLEIIFLKLGSLADIITVFSKIKEEKPVFLNVSELKDKDFERAKQLVKKLVEYIKGNLGGDVFGIGSDYLLITPSNIRIKPVYHEEEEIENFGENPR